MPQIHNKLSYVTTIAIAAGCLISSASYASATTGVGPDATPDACHLPGFGPGDQYHPHIDPADFSPDVTNELFPLTPGTTYIYSGTKDRKRAVDVVAPSSRTKLIDGVTTRVVEDRLYLDGILRERTSDYYAQDKCGNVWYFGEDTAELDRDGHVVSTEGSFHAGIDGAEPGVYMQRAPELGRRFRQEWYEGQAEDVFKVVDLSTAIDVPFGSFSDALRTAETTDLEPGVLDNKWYVRGIGQVEELTVNGPTEKLVLVDFLSRPVAP